MKNKTIPSAGDYNFSVNADADGWNEDVKGTTLGEGTGVKTFHVEVPNPIVTMNADDEQINGNVLTLPVTVTNTGANWKLQLLR